LPLRQVEIFLCGLHRGLVLMQLGRELLGILNGATAPTSVPIIRNQPFRSEAPSWG
jgi:hypothetical protein